MEEYIMTTERMTIHEALSELKVLDKRIKQEIAATTFSTSNLHCNAKIYGVSIEEYKNAVKSKYDKITDLIKRRTAIKKAITNSNAVTVVTIGEMSMTVAEAIEYKRSGIEFKRVLLEKVSKDYNTASLTTMTRNESLTDRATDNIERTYGNKENVNKEALESAREKFIADNTYDMVDPIDSVKIMEKLSDEIDNFMSKVDSTLSVSNALTKIDIEY
jgi:hypothetical protein